VTHCQPFPHGTLLGAISFFRRRGAEPARPSRSSRESTTLRYSPPAVERGGAITSAFRRSAIFLVLVPDGDDKDLNATPNFEAPHGQ